MIIKTCIFIIVILSIYVYLTKKDIFNPGILFSYVWLTVIGISSLYLSGLQHEWDLRFIFILVLSTMAFILGTMCIKTNVVKKAKETLKINLEDFKEKYSEKKIFMVLKVLFILSLFSYILTIMVLGPPPIFSNSSYARNEYYLPVVELMYLNSIVFMNLSYIYVLVYNKNKLFLFILNMVSFLMLLTKTNKYQLIIVMLLYLISYNLFKGKVGFKKLLIAAFVVLAVFVAFYKYVYAGSIISLETRVSVNQFKLGENFSFLVDPYLYVSMNLENLKHFTELSIQHTYGLQTFSGVLSIIKANNLLMDGYNLSNEWMNNLQYNWLNTGSYLYYFYWDFGLLGVVIGPFFLGLASKYYYKKVLNSQANIFNVFMYQYLIFAILVSFFSFIFIQLPIIFNLVSIYFIEKYSRRKTVKVYKEELVNGI